MGEFAIIQIADRDIAAILEKHDVVSNFLRQMPSLPINPNVIQSEESSKTDSQLNISLLALLGDRGHAYLNRYFLPFQEINPSLALRMTMEWVSRNLSCAMKKFEGDIHSDRESGNSLSEIIESINLPLIPVVAELIGFEVFQIFTSMSQTELASVVSLLVDDQSVTLPTTKHMKSFFMLSASEFKRRHQLYLQFSIHPNLTNLSKIKQDNAILQSTAEQTVAIELERIYGQYVKYSPETLGVTGNKLKQYTSHTKFAEMVLSLYFEEKSLSAKLSATSTDPCWDDFRTILKSNQNRNYTQDHKILLFDKPVDILATSTVKWVVVITDLFHPSISQRLYLYKILIQLQDILDNFSQEGNGLIVLYNQPASRDLGDFLDKSLDQTNATVGWCCFLPHHCPDTVGQSLLTFTSPSLCGIIHKSGGLHCLCANDEVNTLQQISESHETPKQRHHTRSNHDSHLDPHHDYVAMCHCVASWVLGSDLFHKTCEMLNMLFYGTQGEIDEDRCIWTAASNSSNIAAALLVVLLSQYLNIRHAYIIDGHILSLHDALRPVLERPTFALLSQSPSLSKTVRRSSISSFSTPDYTIRVGQQLSRIECKTNLDERNQNWDIQSWISKQPTVLLDSVALLLNIFPNITYTPCMRFCFLNWANESSFKLPWDNTLEEPIMKCLAQPSANGYLSEAVFKNSSIQKHYFRIMYLYRISGHHETSKQCTETIRAKTAFLKDEILTDIARSLVDFAEEAINASGQRIIRNQSMATPLHENHSQVRISSEYSRPENPNFISSAYVDRVSGQGASAIKGRSQNLLNISEPDNSTAFSIGKIINNSQCTSPVTLVHVLAHCLATARYLRESTIGRIHTLLTPLCRHTPEISVPVLQLLTRIEELAHSPVAFILKRFFTPIHVLVDDSYGACIGESAKSLSINFADVLEACSITSSRNYAGYARQLVFDCFQAYTQQADLLHRVECALRDSSDILVYKCCCMILLASNKCLELDEDTAQHHLSDVLSSVICKLEDDTQCNQYHKPWKPEEDASITAPSIFVYRFRSNAAENYKICNIDEHTVHQSVFLPVHEQVLAHLTTIMETPPSSSKMFFDHMFNLQNDENKRCGFRDQKPCDVSPSTRRHLFSAPSETKKQTQTATDKEWTEHFGDNFDLHDTPSSFQSTIVVAGGDASFSVCCNALALLATTKPHLAWQRWPRLFPIDLEQINFNSTVNSKIEINDIKHRCPSMPSHSLQEQSTPLRNSAKRKSRLYTRSNSLQMLASPKSPQAKDRETLRRGLLQKTLSISAPLKPSTFVDEDDVDPRFRSDLTDTFESQEEDALNFELDDDGAITIHKFTSLTSSWFSPNASYLKTQQSMNHVDSNGLMKGQISQLEGAIETHEQKSQHNVQDDESSDPCCTNDTRDTRLPASCANVKSNAQRRIVSHTDSNFIGRLEAKDKLNAVPIRLNQDILCHEAVRSSNVIFGTEYAFGDDTITTKLACEKDWEDPRCWSEWLCKRSSWHKKEIVDNMRMILHSATAFRLIRACNKDVSKREEMVDDLSQKMTSLPVRATTTDDVGTKEWKEAEHFISSEAKLRLDPVSLLHRMLLHYVCDAQATVSIPVYAVEVYFAGSRGLCRYLLTFTSTLEIQGPDRTSSFPSPPFRLDVVSGATHGEARKYHTSASHSYRKFTATVMRPVHNDYSTTQPQRSPLKLELVRNDGCQTIMNVMSFQVDVAAVQEEGITITLDGIYRICGIARMSVCPLSGIQPSSRYPGLWLEDNITLQLGCFHADFRDPSFKKK